MAKVKTYQPAFVAGELSPTMIGRFDLESYLKGAEKLRNVYVTPQGGAFRREGLRIVDRTTRNGRARLVPFEFNTEQQYLLKFTSKEMKVYRKVAGVDVLQATVSNAIIDKLTWDVLSSFRWTQSADTLILVHPDIKPIEITRTSNTAWTAAHVSLSNIPDFDFGSGVEPVISAARGWPRTVAFYSGRLWFGGTKSRPQTLLASKVGDFFDFDKGTALADEALDITIDDDRVNAIEALFPGQALQVYTTGGEFIIVGSLGDPITPEKIATQLQKQTLHGASAAGAVSVDGSTIFVQKGGQVIRQFAYSDLEQSYNAPDISLRSAHLIRNPVRLAVRQSPNADFPADYVYAVNNDGTVAVLNVLRDESLLAWTLFETTQGKIEDIAVVGNEVYFVVLRDVNTGGGATGALGGTYVERFVERLDADYFMDFSVKQTSGTPKTSWTGLDSLNTETAWVRGDDYILNNETVASGAITSSESVSELEVGLFSASRVKTLPAVLEFNGQLTIGDRTRLVSALLNLYKSRELIVTANGRTYRPPFRKFGSAVLDQPVSEFTGYKKVHLGGHNRNSQVDITQEQPLEFNILSVALDVEV